MSKEYWELVENGITVAPLDATPKERKLPEEIELKDLKTKNYPRQAIDQTILETILNWDTTKYIWDSMRRKYRGSMKLKRTQLHDLRQEFEVLYMKDNEIIDVYFAIILAIANKITTQGEKMEQTIIVEKVLWSKTIKFNYVLSSIK